MYDIPLASCQVVCNNTTSLRQHIVHMQASVFTLLAYCLCCVLQLLLFRFFPECASPCVGVAVHLAASCC